MADLNRVYDLIAESEDDGRYKIQVLRAHVDQFAQDIERCRLLNQNGSIYCDTREYQRADESFDFIRGYLHGMEVSDLVSSERIDDCIDELISAFDF